MPAPIGAAAYRTPTTTTEMGGSGFGATLRRALEGALDAGHEADRQSQRALTGAGNVTETVMAVSRAELALQTAVALREKVVQAYQDVMRMPI
ncbi:flagellar hook-basal body complex protein FliE [Muricoccus radiodurans]|uniref:flagellar hook-basal body complex protein FliE n=1 Tax=Muricoccus radiodurans TaxID=2231721 RepID=UPI003CE773A8